MASPSVSHRLSPSDIPTQPNGFAICLWSSLGQQMTGEYTEGGRVEWNSEKSSQEPASFWPKGNERADNKDETGKKR